MGGIDPEKPVSSHLKKLTEMYHNLSYIIIQSKLRDMAQYMENYTQRYISNISKSVTVLTLWVAPPKMFYMFLGIGLNGSETNCAIAHILGILLMNSYDFRYFEQQQFAVCPFWIGMNTFFEGKG